MIVAVVFICLFLLPAILAISYLLFFATLGLFKVRNERTPGQQIATKFAILIPAHNEGDFLVPTLESTKSIDYPQDLHDVFVIADNCTDRTGKVARAYGVYCWERIDNNKKGKGPALRWAFQKLDWNDYHAALVVDADCLVRPDLLSILDAFVQTGALAVQSNHFVANADESPVSYAAAIGRTLEYELFFSPKSRLGLGVMLVGTGMMFHRKLLNQIPWNAEGCAEDTEYTFALCRQKHYVQFAANGYLDISGAVTSEELDVQRKRWASGNLNSGKRLAIEAIVSGILRLDFRQIDLGFALILASRPLVILHACLTLFLGALWYWLYPGSTSKILFIAAIGITLAHLVYFSIGIFWLGLNRRRVKHLSVSPWVVCRLIAIACGALFLNRRSGWNRTPRG